MERNRVIVADVLDGLAQLPDESVQCVVTSPPYWGLRDYQVDGQIGLERSPELYVEKMVEVFRAVRRVLRGDGVAWLNLGDSYASGYKGRDVLPRGGHEGKQRYVKDYPQLQPNRMPISCMKPKDLIGMPWRVAFALQTDGWYLRSDCIWHKVNCMPSSVRDRPTTAHEYVFLLSKSQRYFYDAEAVKEDASGTAHARGSGVNPKAKAAGKNSRMNIDRDVVHANRAIKSRQNESFSAAVAGLVERRNLRTVWRIPSHSFRGSHFATFPPRLAETCIKAGTSERGACPTCGECWVRITEKTRVATRPGSDSKVTGDSLVDGNRDPHRHVTATRTIGWQQACKCEQAEPVPCVVLDPFFGAGTVRIVAESLGRHWIGCELNPDYARLALERPPYVPQAPRVTRSASLLPDPQLLLNLE